ncbi:hypothetical protein PT974_07695 [Cladobotryum mycophilum]|uniref:Uncharacterized protein n=1 Tax=Cladobotryum mycophilum TaxID=491253 RepID=A0ABR0SHK9_9HYPO
MTYTSPSISTPININISKITASILIFILLQVPDSRPSIHIHSTTAEAEEEAMVPMSKQPRRINVYPVSRRLGGELMSGPNLQLLVAGFAAAAAHVNLAHRGGPTLIRYRTVNPAETNAVNDAGTLIKKDIFNNISKAQFGPGVYTSLAPDERDVGSGNWYYIIHVDSDALNRVPKAWIPEKEEEAVTP